MYETVYNQSLYLYLGFSLWHIHLFCKTTVLLISTDAPKKYSVGHNGTNVGKYALRAALTHSSPHSPKGERATRSKDKYMRLAV